MPINWKKYAKNFPKRRKECREQAQDRCQGCGLVHGDINKKSGKLSRQWLNAHHPDCDPLNPDARLIALCPSCHRNREPYDAMKAAGQLPLFPDTDL